jgi:hypothetical protein
VHEKDGKFTTSVENGAVTDLASNAGKITFTFAAESLPWVLPSDAAEGFRLTDATHRFGDEKLTINALKPGKYDVKIDNQSVGIFTEEELEAGIQLGANPKTPQYQQALKVATLNKERNDKAYHPIRDQYAALKGKRRDVNKATETKDPALETKKAELESFIVSMKKNVADLQAKARGFEDQIYVENQPKPHRYEITLVQ